LQIYHQSFIGLQQYRRLTGLIVNFTALMFRKFILFFIFYLTVAQTFAQTCDSLGQIPTAAFPVCGSSVFHQGTIVNCNGPDIAQRVCPQGVTSSSSSWYKFTCFQTGTLGFLLSGISSSDDYDWALFDITGQSPTAIFSNASLLVSLNIYGVSSSAAAFPNSPTGCVPAGTGNVHCAGSDPGNTPFNAMPTIIIGHNYLLMVTNYSQSTAGYDLTFTGGSASIKDPNEPHMINSRAACDGTKATIKLNQKLKCNSLTANGSEFTIEPKLANVIAATGYGCDSNYDMDSLILTLDAPIPPGTYKIYIDKKFATDGNTLLDYCDKPILDSEYIPMVVFPLFPTPMDSISKIGCAPDELQLVFRKNIDCKSIAADGSDFVVSLITGTTPVSVISASGNCSADGFTPIIKVKLSAPIQTKGTYQIQLVTGSDGNTIIDECNQQTPAGATLIFNTKDTVNADFSYAIRYGCDRDTINYFHDGRNEVNYWKWNFDRTRGSSLQNPTILYGSFGEKKTYLIVSNGVCRDTTDTVKIFLDNEVKAAFEATRIVCPDEAATFLDKSIGNIVSWSWDFGNGNTSNLQTTSPQTYMHFNPTRDVYPRLIVQNNLGCFDTSTQKIIIPYSCYIAVPNAFTPNGDGLNDYLYPLNAYKASDLLFRVYNRVGQMVFETRDWTKKWNGKFKGQPADFGTYVWILVYTDTDTGKRVQKKGSTILLH
jgi:gliding motility-associated-like protein